MKFQLSCVQDRRMTGSSSSKETIRLAVNGKCGNVTLVSKGACLKEIGNNSELDRVSIGLVELAEYLMAVDMLQSEVGNQ